LRFNARIGERVPKSRKKGFNRLCPNCSESTLQQAALRRGIDDYDVLADGAVVGRIFKANASPVGTPWMWALAFGHHEDCTRAHGYEATREAAMAAFAKSWRRE
jgi:hypothetical protein